MSNNLIIQGDKIATPTLKQLARLSGAESIHALDAQIFRLANADDSKQAEIEEICAAQTLDYGFIPAQRKLSDFKLLAMDMDSTLIAIECIDEVADMTGLKAEVAAITQSAMRGEIGFAESLTRRVSLLSGLDATALERVYDERLRLNPGAETLIAALQRHGIKTLLVSGGFTFFTERLQSRLNLDYSAANTLEIHNGKLTGRILGDILDAQGKADRMNAIRQELGLAQSQVVAIGDGANDLLMLGQAAVSVAYHAKPIVRAQAAYALNFSDLSAVLPLLGQT